MRLVSLSTLLIALLCGTLCASAATSAKHKKAATPQHTATKHVAIHSASHSKTSKHRSSKTKKAVTKKIVAHPPMDTARATTIQTALIKSGYLSGEPTGTWDAQSSAAMQKLQSDNGWQTKIVPDSRALIKLGLGPQPPSP